MCAQNLQRCTQPDAMLSRVTQEYAIYTQQSAVEAIGKTTQRAE